MTSKASTPGNSQNADFTGALQGTGASRGIGLKRVDRAGVKDNGDMSFIMLTESQMQLPPRTPTKQIHKQDAKTRSAATPKGGNMDQALSSRIESTDSLFEILSAYSDIDHPICSECTELLLSSLQKRLSETTKERDAFISFLKEMKSNVPAQEESDKARKDISNAQEVEEQALKEVLELEKETARLLSKLTEMEEQECEQQEDENSFWKSHNSTSDDLLNMENNVDAITTANKHDQEQLERLRRTNVYNDTFCIGHDKIFGTINGLRLGRMPAPNSVEWWEINTAWGLAAWCLNSIARQVGFVFEGYRIVSMGSVSYIEKIEGVTNAGATSVLSGKSTRKSNAQAPKITMLPLHSSGDVPIGLALLHRHFNDAMVAFLQCMNQLGSFVAHSASGASTGQQKGGFKLLYSIEKDLINNTSIKLGTGQDEAWTSACKYTLTNCKLLLAHISNLEGGRANA